MFVKKHYAGLAISYNSTGGGQRSLLAPLPSKKNNSRLSRQKRQIHDAVEWMRRNAVHKPLIFCLTVPVESDYKTTNENVSKFTENLRARYGVVNYVWVREYQPQTGRPHYHFVADAPRLDVIHLSHYWCALFVGAVDRGNSLRLGTAPPARKMFVDSPRMARYLTKYMGKGLSDDERKGKKRIRTFAMSQEVAAKSAPVTYKAEYVELKEVRRDVFGTFNGTKYRIGEAVPVITDIQRAFTLCENSEAELIAVYGNVPEELKEFDDTNYSWICPNPLHRVYYGIPKPYQKVHRKSGSN